jgi:arginyl-tRNA synthetase
VVILRFHAAVRAALTDTLLRVYALEPAAVPSIVLEAPPTRAMGDLACPVAFELARRLRKAPRAIAADVVAALGPIPGVTKAVAAPNGYVNVFLDRAAVVRLALGIPVDTAPPSEPLLPAEKTIVEHTAINPNKAAHIGHLRNTTLGDTLVRLLRHGGVPVEVQNYIDDTGVQVADVVVGFQHLEGKTLDDVRAIADSTRFDYYCWDLYAKVTEWYDADKARLKVRSETLHAIEHGGNDTAALGAFVADRIVRAHLATMARLNVDYDLLTWEGDILRLKFWQTAFDLLRESGTMFKQTEGKLAGCWVMPIDEDPTATPALGEPADLADAGAGPAGADAGDDQREPDQREKVIVRSDGTVTYVGKDIAYQYWKLGLLGKDFHYRPFGTRLAGDTLWATTTTPGGDRPDRPAFGRAHAVYNVIDTRQSYLQKLLKQALWTLGHHVEAERSTHFSYEMVALSHRTARELGYTGQDESKPFVEVSGRKGLGVKADDLLDRLIAKAQVEVEARNAAMTPEETQRTATMLGVSAVRYFLVKFTRTKMIAFDMDEALAFEGESGPYLQYSVVRAQNIFAKLAARDGVTEEDLAARLASTPTDALEPGDDGDALWQLALEAARLDEVVVQAVRALEPAVLAKYAFGLAQTFNAVYHRFPILNEEREPHRLWRAAVISAYRRQLTAALGLMGIDVPARM